jgi:hypothetical protein
VLRFPCCKARPGLSDPGAQAIAAWNRALAAEPSNGEVLLSMGVSYTNELDQGRALGFLRRWLERRLAQGGVRAHGRGCIGAGCLERRRVACSWAFGLLRRRLERRLVQGGVRAGARLRRGRALSETSRVGCSWALRRLVAVASCCKGMRVRITHLRANVLTRAHPFEHG